MLPDKYGIITFSHDFSKKSLRIIKPATRLREEPASHEEYQQILKRYASNVLFPIDNVNKLQSKQLTKN